MGLGGCVIIVTAYVFPLAIAVLNVKAPFAAIVRLSPPLSCNTIPEPVSPTTVFLLIVNPPYVYLKPDERRKNCCSAGPACRCNRPVRSERPATKTTF